MHAETGAPEFGAEKLRRGKALGVVRLGAPQFVRDDEIAGLQTSCKPAGHADERDRRPGIEPRGELGSGTPGAILPRADDDVGAADGEGFDTKRGQNFELSRWGLRSHSAPVP